MSFELELTLGEEGKQFLTITGEHGRIRNLGFLVDIFVCTKGLFVILAFKGVVPVSQRIVVTIKSFQYPLVVTEAAFQCCFESAEAVEKVVPHSEADDDGRVIPWLRGIQRIWCKE